MVESEVRKKVQRGQLAPKGGDAGTQKVQRGQQAPKGGDAGTTLRTVGRHMYCVEVSCCPGVHACLHCRRSAFPAQTGHMASVRTSASARSSAWMSLASAAAASRTCLASRARSGARGVIIRPSITNTAWVRSIAGSAATKLTDSSDARGQRAEQQGRKQAPGREGKGGWNKQGMYAKGQR
eukprot:358445-Chlamydomonas_euryale.AAC.28